MPTHKTDIETGTDESLSSQENDNALQNNPDYVYNAKKGVYYKKSTIERGKQAVEKINQQREEKRNELWNQEIDFHGSMATFGEKYSMSPTSFSELNPKAPFNPNNAKSEADLERRVKELQHETTKTKHQQNEKNFKNNLISAMNSTFSQTVDQKTMKSLNWWMHNTSYEDISNMYYLTDQFNFDYLYTIHMVMDMGETDKDIVDMLIGQLQTNRKNKRKKKLRQSKAL